jgi:hypothetical protein
MEISEILKIYMCMEIYMHNMWRYKCTTCEDINAQHGSTKFVSRLIYKVKKMLKSIGSCPITIHHP